jgi:hypothetical protein
MTVARARLGLAPVVIAIAAAGAAAATTTRRLEALVVTRIEVSRIEVHG